MIVRILEDGQYEVDEETAKELSAIDDKIAKALDANDEAAFAAALADLVARVHASGKQLEDGDLRPSDLAVPAPESTLAEVQRILGSETTTKD